MPKYLLSLELVRYLANGLAATAVHYSVLRYLMEDLHFFSAGAANFAAALFGISASFLGNRYFVFSRRSKHWLTQASRFGILYGFIACLHAGLLLVWTDIWGLNYSTGFALALAIQISGSYSGNKYFVFNT